MHYQLVRYSLLVCSLAVLSTSFASDCEDYDDEESTVIKTQRVIGNASDGRVVKRYEYLVEKVDMQWVEGHQFDSIEGVFGDFCEGFKPQIHIQHTSISHMPERSFAHVPALEKICMISNPSLKTFDREAFAGLIQLTELDLTCNDIHELPEGLFEQLKHLKRLCLDYNHLKIVAGLCKGLESLEDLQLCDNQIEHISPDMFEDCSQLTHINVIGNPIGKKEVEGLRKQLSSMSIYFE